MADLAPTADRGPPRRVLLFSGHMVDAPDRPVPRFPPSRVPAVRMAIARVLEGLAAGADDLAICGGACGGDLLFAEEALARGVASALYLPFAVPTFLSKSVDFAGGDWHRRFAAVRARSALHVLPDECGPAAPGEDPYERNNLRMLDAAMRHGADRVDFICLWDGAAGDGPGGTQHLLQAVAARGGRTHRIDMHALG